MAFLARGPHLAVAPYELESFIPKIYRRDGQPAWRTAMHARNIGIPLPKNKSEAYLIE